MYTVHRYMLLVLIHKFKSKTAQLATNLPMYMYIPTRNTDTDGYTAIGGCDHKITGEYRIWMRQWIVICPHVSSISEGYMYRGPKEA